MRYQLHYWPIPFRGNFPRIVLHYVGAEFWESQSFEDVMAIKNAPLEKHSFMAVPLLIDNETGFETAQMTAIMTYLGERHGLFPQSVEARAHVQELLGNCLDVLSEITRDEGARQWDQESWNEFASHRLKKWMQIFELRAQASGLTATSFYFGDTLTIADLTNCALWTTMTRALPELREYFETNAPKLAKLCDRISQIPQIADFFDEQAQKMGKTYCGGEIEKSLRVVLSNWQR